MSEALRRRGAPNDDDDEQQQTLQQKQNGGVVEDRRRKRGNLLLRKHFSSLLLIAGLLVTVLVVAIYRRRRIRRPPPKQVVDSQNSIRGSGAQPIPKLPIPIVAKKSLGRLEETPPQAAAGERKKPSKPLCDECLKIIQQAKPMNIAYEDVQSRHVHQHPHKGATFPGSDDETLGYIHDETSLKANPPQFDYLNLQVGCSRRDGNYKMLTEKVHVDFDSDKAKAGSKRDTIFCLVYTTAKNHETRIPGIRETWGPKCDGFMIGSTETDPAIGAVNIVHEGPEEYNNIYQKVRSMWSYVYDHYYEKYDWFHIGGDDLYLIVENLRLYLESEEIKTAANGGIYLPNGSETEQVPLFLGRRFAYMGDMSNIFNSGGSGYTLNKAALKLLVARGFEEYFPHLKTFSEDTMVARILKKYNVAPYETKDEAGGERYMPFLPGAHYSLKQHGNDWYAKYSINIKFGLDHCAAKSVAFHYVDPNSMHRIHAILYGMCPAANTQ